MSARNAWKRERASTFLRRGRVVVVVVVASSSFSSFSVSSASSGDASAPTAMPPPAEGASPRRPAGPRPRRGRRRRRRASGATSAQSASTNAGTPIFRLARWPRRDASARVARSDATPSPLAPSATWRREARRYPNPEAPLRSCARERVKGSGRARWRRLWRSTSTGGDVPKETARTSDRTRASPRSPRLFALGVLIRHEELLGGRHRREGVFLLGGRLLAHRALPTPSRVPTPNPTTAGRRRDDFRRFSGAEMSSRVSRRPARPGLGSAPLRTAMGRGGHSDDEATPYDQSLEELEFMRGACAAAQRGDLRTLRDAVARRPHLLADDGVGGDSGYAPLHYAARARDTPRASPSQARGGRARGPCHSKRAAPPLSPRAYTGRSDVIAIGLRAGATRASDADRRDPPWTRRRRGAGHDSCALLLRACPEAAEARDRRGAVLRNVCGRGPSDARRRRPRRAFFDERSRDAAVREPRSRSVCSDVL